MKLIRFILRNAFRHRLRAVLTIVGLGITIMAFGIVRTILDAFDVSQSEGLQQDLLISRHKTSFMQFLPLSYRDKIADVPGVKTVTFAHWFGMKYGDEQNAFAQLAIDPEHYLDVRKEYKLSKEDVEAFKKSKNACLISKALGLKRHWERGSKLNLVSGIFNNVNYDVEVAGIIELEGSNAQAEFLVLRTDYYTEKLGQMINPELDNTVGWYEIKVQDAKVAPTIAKRIDSLFMNSNAETLTETQEAFASSFVERFRTIVTALQVVSYLTIIVVLMVLLNTMSMSARERVSENAVLKTLGFRPLHIGGMALGESLVIAVLGGALGAFLVWPGMKLFGVAVQGFQGTHYDFRVLIWIAGCALVVAVLAALLPIVKAVKTPIVEGLRVVD